MNVGDVGPTIGLIREGTIKRYDSSKGIVRVGFNMGGDVSEYDMSIPASWQGPNGEFSGGCPTPGQSVWCALNQGTRWSILSYSKPDRNKNTPGISLQNNLLSALRPGRWLTQVQNNIRLFADPTIGIQAGNPSSFIHLDPAKNISSNTFGEQLSFSEANRKITGPLKRDLKSNSNRNITGSSLTSHSYDESLQVIRLDPKGDSSTRNPPFNESREVVYEFSNSFGFTNDSTEISIYDDNKLPALDNFFNRRKSRADVLSLSLSEPNHLLETIKGTVVDFYGNLVDLNRSILPSGKIDSLSFRKSENNKSDTFISLREQARKTIAYHFELNARKAKPPDDKSITSPVDYARDRSRFSIDIDKEGQFKINVPASSEVGNISLLTRYENYATLMAANSGGDINPNKLLRNDDNHDILHDEFGVGAVELKGGIDSLKSFVAPIDRIKNEPIKLGTAYHDVQQTLQLHNRVQPVYFYEESTLNTLPQVGRIIAQEITVSGPDANAGGRSGTISLDGFMNISIGANTSDRQSLWLDMAGGMVMNVGRDLNNRSLQSRFDGDVFIQIGGETVANDSRFGAVNNAVRDGTLDLRIVQNGGSMTIFRVSTGGVQVATAGTVDVVSSGLMRFKSINNNIVFDAEEIYMYGNKDEMGRLVERTKGRTI